MRNNKNNSSLIFGTLFIIAFIFISSCTPILSRGLSEDIIWKGYLEVTINLSNNKTISEEAAIQDAKIDYYYDNLGLSKISLPETYDPNTNPDASIPPVPLKLRDNRNLLTAQQYHVRILLKQNREEVIVLSFVQWDGTNDWWVREVGSKVWRQIKT